MRGELAAPREGRGADANARGADGIVGSRGSAASARPHRTDMPMNFDLFDRNDAAALAPAMARDDLAPLALVSAPPGLARLRVARSGKRPPTVDRRSSKHEVEAS